MKTKTDGGHDIDEKDLEEMRAEAGTEDEAGGGFLRPGRVHGHL
mgnify:CR=1 FL=1